MTEPVDWYFDVISPFAWLQWQRLQRDHPVLAARLRPVPVLLAGLLAHHRTLGPAETPGKRRFTYRHVLWRARRDGLRLTFPPAHPFNPLPALRLILAAGGSHAAVAAVLDYVWGQGRAGDGAAALEPVAGRLGIADVAAAIADPGVKARLQANTAAAIAAGVFGVPTLAIAGETFWGDDATAMAADWLADRAGFEDPAMRALEVLPAAVQRRTD